MHSLKKIIHNGPILMKSYQPVLGVRFFKHSVEEHCYTKCSMYFNLPHADDSS